MRLSSIQLLNWKSYRRTIIRIPPASERANVVVIEGYNGAGKTSLLEAISFCLFGRGGLGLVARASGGSRSDHSYDGFLERALNVAAQGQSARMSVHLEFELGQEIVGIERTWHFSAAGRHRREDEEVRLFDGPDADLVAVPSAPDGEDFVRAFVGKHFIAPNLAGFFLIDGENLERLSAHSIDDQLWGAIDAVLGAPALRGLAADLRDYGRERKRHVPHNMDERALRDSEELHRLAAAEQVAAAEVEALLSSLAPLRREREDIVKSIGSLRGDSYKSFKLLFEQREASVRVRDEQREELRRLLNGDLALALAGRSLRSRAVNRIAAEDRTERWQNGSLASRNRFDELLRGIERHQAGDFAEAQLRAAWDELWDTQPADCIEQIRHGHLGETDRRAVSDHLNRLSSVSADVVGALSQSIAAHDIAIAAVEREIGKQRGVDVESQALADELTKVQELIATIEAKHLSKVEELEMLRARLATKREEFGILLADNASAAPLLQRADRANRVATLIDRLIEAAIPANLEEISSAVTEAYRDMAHKGVVQQIRIRSGEKVQLLDDEGADISAVDASAGESQIFALAIMSGLARMAADFPIIMDTPLARLDPLHRHNVLTHFARGARQLILLTHPAELGPDELELLEPYLAATISIGQRPVPQSATN